MSPELNIRVALGLTPTSLQSPINFQGYWDTGITIPIVKPFRTDPYPSRYGAAGIPRNAASASAAAAASVMEKMTWECYLPVSSSTSSPAAIPLPSIWCPRTFDVMTAKWVSSC